MKKTLLAHQGREFTLEWYFNDQGKSEALDYFNDLPSDRKKKMTHLFFLLGDIGKVFNKEKFRYEGDQIYALKTSPDRFFCFFFDGAKVIITNGYEKKTDKMPPKEKQKALKAKADYEKRHKRGNYYP